MSISVSAQSALEKCLAAQSHQKKSIKTTILAFMVIQGHWNRWQSRATRVTDGRTDRQNCDG